MGRLSNACFLAMAIAASGCGSCGGGQPDGGPPSEDAGQDGVLPVTGDAGQDAGTPDAGEVDAGQAASITVTLPPGT